MKKLTTLVVLLMTSLSFYGQSGSINGKVVSSKDQPIATVTILLENESKGTTTNNKGLYTLNNLEAGKHIIKFSSIGFTSQKVTVKVVENKETTLPKITLQEAQEQLNEVVVQGKKNHYVARAPSSSLRLKTALIKTPQNIQVITSDLLKDQQATDMMQSITRNVSGAQMIEHWGTFARINMRGFKLPAFRNGMNREMPWGPLSEDMSMVERIEFVKGPAGFMMAAGEPGGFYNIVTKQPIAEKTAEVTFMVGSFNTYRGTVDLGSSTKDGKFMYRLNAMAKSGESHRDFEESSRVSIVPAVKYQFSSKTSLSTEFTFQHADTPIGRAYVFAPSTAGYGVLSRDFSTYGPDFPNTDIEEISLFTNFTHNFNKNWGLVAQHAYTRYDQVGYSAWPRQVAENGDMIRGVNVWDALNLANLAQVFVNGQFTTGPISHKILAGFDYNDKKYWTDWNQSAAIDINTPFNIYNPDYSTSVMPTIDRSVNIKERGKGNYQGAITRGYYLQDEIGFLEDKIRLTLAARYTDALVFAYGNDTKDNKLTPRVGLSVDVLPNLTVYGLYDQSFIPKFGASVTGENFEPEEAVDIEGGIKKNWFNGRLSTTLGVYQITKQNILVADPDNINFSIQLGEVQSKGIEFDMQGQLTPELNVVLNYANTNVEITEDTDPEKIGNRIAGHSKHITNAWLNYSFKERSALKGFSASIGYQYQVDRSSWTWTADNQTDLPDYFRLDGGLSWKNEKLNIRLNVNNLLDKYLYSGANYGSYLYWQSEPGINGSINIAYKF